MTLKYYILRWARQWVELAESIIGVLSLGFYNPYWSFKLLTWEMKQNLKK